MCRRTWDGKELELREEHGALFDKAKALHDAGGGMDEIMQLVFDRNSRIWFDRGGMRMRGCDVKVLPLYLAIKSMAQARGVAMGLLSESMPATRPELDDFEAKN